MIPKITDGFSPDRCPRCGKHHYGQCQSYAEISLQSQLTTALARAESAEKELAQKDNPDAPLSAELIGGKIVISMGAETLRFCHNENEKEAEPSKGFGTGFLITNALGFAGDVIRELNAEREDGSTIVTDLFDKAIEKAANNGSTNTEERFGWFCGWCDKGMPESERGYVHSDKTCYCSEDCAKEKEANQ